MIPKEFITNWASDNGVSVEDVNEGSCECFADAAIEFVPGAELVGTDNFVDWDSEDWPGGHIWLYDGIKHYDCQNPEGVEQWQDLEFFKQRGKMK